ncbi:MAG: ABC transporter permease [Thermoplasmata archaeon]|uniref:ABC transporter permease n=1 Tax=Candidatus Sysuiplasma superficiale TaxID=2823368 RepID=A0A8J7YQY9_9ARCH|nr:ABC transporter permease [Candidatus Sysuiplasma superficiale]MBX8643576.1 ABC transporter permease [Candidatus Sysuiplasma superficiale]MCL4346957.1 ABC transporter permease [Candidatus Thermoplasmatota archaeon]MCL5437508.1 ABC transporter permease [Candidatus Thermoplasmatota archaeon]
MNLRLQLRAMMTFLIINGVIALRRQTTILISISLAPFTFIYFLYLVSTRAELPYGVVGAIVFTTVFTGNMMLNDAAYLRLERHLQALYVASPVRAFSYATGMAVSELVFIVPPLTVLFIVLGFVIRLSIPVFLSLLGIIFLTWVMSSSLGFMISSFFRQLREIWPIASLVFSVISIIPPIFYPITAIPSSFRWLAYLAPTTYSALLGDSVVGITHVTAATQFLYISGLLFATLVFILIAMVFTRWREK